MGKVYVIVFVLGAFLFGCNPDESGTLPPSSAYIKVYGGTGTDEAADLAERENGGLMIVGNSNSSKYSSGTSVDFLVIATDKNGNEENSYYYDRVVPGNASAITTDKAVKIRARTEQADGYVAVGTSSFGANDDIFIVKIAPDGSFDAESVFVFPDTEYQFVTEPHTYSETAADIVEVSDGFVVVGTTTKTIEKQPGTSVSDQYDLLVFKVSKDFSEVLWREVRGYIGNDYGVALERGRGDEIVVVGRTSSSVEGASLQQNDNVMYVRFDTNGKVLTSTTFGRGEHERATAMVRNSGGDFYIAGNSVSPGTGVMQPFLLRVVGDEELSYNLVQAATEPVTGIDVSDLTRTDLGQLIFTGRILATEDAGKRTQAIMIRTGSAGELDETFADNNVTNGRTFGGNSEDRGNALIQMTDGRLALLSTMDLNETNTTTLITLIKTNRNGILGK